MVTQDTTRSKQEGACLLRSELASEIGQHITVSSLRAGETVDVFHRYRGLSK